MRKMVLFFLFLSANFMLIPEVAAHRLVQTVADGPTEFEQEIMKVHHKRPYYDKSIVFAEVMLGGLAVVAALAIFAYIRVTRRRDDVHEVVSKV